MCMDMYINQIQYVYGYVLFLSTKLSGQEQTTELGGGWE